MKRIIAVLLLVVGVAHAAGDSRRRAVGKPSSAGPLPVANFIDTHIGAKLTGAGILPAASAKDEEFLRRVTVDLAGAIPTAAEVETFLADTRTDKRARKIDELLNSSAFVDRWTMWYGDLVQNVQASDAVRQYYLGRNVHYLWIKESIRTGKAYDAMVREDLAGEGNNFTSGTANYVVRQIQNNGPSQDTYDNLAAHSAEKFLGIPMLCISCHGGPGHLELVNIYLRGKTRDDFWKMAAFFSRTSARGSRYTDPANPNQNIIQFDVGTIPNGVYRLNTTDGNKTPRAPAAGQPNTVTPAFILTGEQPQPGEPYRVAYGRMLTADRQFARATVNYLWKEMFGIGIVEPANAFDLARLTAQPSHPELLEALADDFISGGYNIRSFLRTIALSNTYQLSSAYAGTHPDATYFARRSPRRLSAEALLDAVTTATAVPVSLPVAGLTPVAKAMQLPDPLEARRSPASLFLNQFGRGNRDDVARTNDSAISQALAMMNDPIVTTRVRRANNSTVSKVLASTSDPGTIADQLYLATLSRKPTSSERQAAITYLLAGTLAERAEDLQFALINSLEFLFV
ncbi:MAG: DUF1549 and DUF1553 domain-containing protein [Acidobacteriota bacterium]|nr:DUF1549 and DUF1553 domain-containing protein [Acidobacteriota bacterium]